MWYERDYGVSFRWLVQEAVKLFDLTFNAIFNSNDTNLFEVLLVGLLVSFMAGFLLYMLRQNRK